MDGERSPLPQESGIHRNKQKHSGTATFWCTIHAFPTTTYCESHVWVSLEHSLNYVFKTQIVTCTSPHPGWNLLCSIANILEKKISGVGCSECQFSPVGKNIFCWGCTFLSPLLMIWLDKGIVQRHKRIRLKGLSKMPFSWKKAYNWECQMEL